MTFSLDPLWISVLITFVLVIITGYYAWQTKNSTDISRMAFLYQRKPRFILVLRNENNDIYCVIRNDEKSVGTIKNIAVKLQMRINGKQRIIGRYHINGILCPGEEDSPNITAVLKEKLEKLNLMSHHVIKEPNEDEYGWYYAKEKFYEIGKKIIFRIKTEATYELDVEELSDKTFHLSREFVVTLIPIFGPPDANYDLYETDIKMELGKWK